MRRRCPCRDVHRHHKHYRAGFDCGQCLCTQCRCWWCRIFHRKDRRPPALAALQPAVPQPPVPPVSDTPVAQASSGASYPAGRPVAPGPSKRRTVWRLDMADCGCIRTYDFLSGAVELTRCDWHAFDVAAWNARLQA